MRIPVGTELYICGSAYFLMRDRMQDMVNFRVRDTNKRVEEAVCWKQAHGLWILQDDRQVFGAFDCKRHAAQVAVAGPKWRTHLFVKWLGIYLKRPPKLRRMPGWYRPWWKVTFHQTTEQLDGLRVEE
jgi:hypothetical protein